MVKSEVKYPALEIRIALKGNAYEEVKNIQINIRLQRGSNNTVRGIR